MKKVVIQIKERRYNESQEQSFLNRIEKGKISIARLKNTKRKSKRKFSFHLLVDKLEALPNGSDDMKKKMVLSMEDY